VYAIGVVLWELLKEERAWKDYEFVHIFSQLVGKKKPLPTNHISHPQVRDLVTACVSLHPADRPDANEVVNTLNDIIEQLRESEFPVEIPWEELAVETTTILGEGIGGQVKKGKSLVFAQS